MPGLKDVDPRVSRVSRQLVCGPFADQPCWSRPLKIAGYIHPGFISPGPLWNYGWLNIAELLQTLRRDAGCDCTLIASSRFLREAQRDGTSGRLRGLRVVEIDDGTVFKQTSALGVTPKRFDELVCTEESVDHPALRMLAATIAQKFGSPGPDVLLSFATPTDFLAGTWPRTFRLHVESLFSRNPFPANVFFDHLGMYRRSIVCRAGARLCNYVPNDAGKALFAAFRSHVGTALETVDPFHSVDIGHGFERVCLLPLQVSNWYGFDAQADYRTQFEYLFDVLSAAPPDVGLIVTEHVNCGHVLKESGFGHNLDYLRTTFPNMIFLEQTRSFSTSSQFLVPRVDGVWSVSSGVAFQALLFGRMLGSPPSSYLAGVAHATDFAGFFANLGRAEPESRDGFMTWQLERYMVPSSLLADGRWLRDYFLRRMEAARAAQDPVDAFVPIADLERLMDAWVARAPRPVALPFRSPDAVEFLRAQLSALRRSRSMRVTAPLRALERLIGRARRPS